MGFFRRRVCAVALCFIATGCGGSSQPARPSVATGVNVISVPVAKRHRAPSFRGESLRPGPRVDSRAYAGKILVVNFWGSWCGPCRREQPFLEKLSRAYASKGVVFIGVSARDQKAAALAYMDEFKVTYPSIYDPDAAVSQRFVVRYMPGTYVIDRDGKIAATIVGGLEKESDLKDVLDKELA